jgi:hypothetical protein
MSERGENHIFLLLGGRVSKPSSREGFCLKLSLFTESKPMKL